VSGSTPSRRLIAIKVGGGLTAFPGALDRVSTTLSGLAGQYRILVLPGGGPFADAVRAFQRQDTLSADAAHWMAIQAMDQYAQVLAERIVGAELVNEPGAVLAALEHRAVVVLAPYRWMRAADVLPHSWNATSDSVAAFVAGAFDATCLILIKPVGSADPRMVDPCFASVLPANLPWATISWDQLDRLPARLKSSEECRSEECRSEK
jgi:5-(aminomethyl)-3-furanmethanol phosphate kinase